MEGGRLLGSGTYGCVFTPPLLCNNSDYKPKKNEVGKITAPDDFKNEFVASKELKSVKDGYFILLNENSICRPKKLDSQPDKKDIKECNFLKEYSLNNVLHFTMPYGGVNINLKFIEKDSNKQISLLPFTKHLLEAGSQLALHGYIHYDIYQSNIIINEKTLLPSLIDFGMSFSSKTIDKDVISMIWKVYSPDHSPEPPEVTCMTAIRNKIPVETCLKDMIAQRVVLKDIERFLGVPIKTQISKFIKFWKSSKVCKDRNWLDFFKLYWTGFDAWGIGVYLIEIMKLFLYYQKNPERIEGFTAVKRVIKGLLILDPRGRLDCLEALSELDPENEILNSTAGKAWLKERKKIRDEFKDV